MLKKGLKAGKIIYGKILTGLNKYQIKQQFSAISEKAFNLSGYAFKFFTGKL